MQEDNPYGIENPTRQSRNILAERPDILQRIQQRKSDALRNSGNNIPAQQPSGFDKFLENYPSTRAGLAGIREKADDYFIPEILREIGHAGTGAVEGISNMGISLANLGLKALPIKKPRIPGEPLGEGESYNESYRLPHINLGQHLEDPGLAYSAGNILSQIAPYNKALAATDKLARPSGYMGILSDLMKGGGVGYALGENAEGERTIPAALGAIFKGIGGVRNEKIANRIVEDAEKAKTVYKHLYDKLFEKSNQYGIGKIEPPKMDWHKLFENADGKQLKALKNLKKNFTVENAHDAQSTLGQIERRLHQSTNKDWGAINRTNAARKELQESIYKAFEKAKKPELVNQYKNITSGYKKDVVPYFNKNIEEYINNEIKAGTMIKGLSKGKKAEKFELSEVGKKYPEIKVGKWLKRIGLGTAGLATAGGGIKKGFDMMSGE